jgi:hypothetical protein
MDKRNILLSASKIRCFKECKRRYYFQYIEKIEMPKTEALETGINYHESVGKYLKGETVEYTPMLSAFVKNITLPKIQHVERPFDVSIGYGIRLVGYIDAVALSGEPIEHKTTSTKIDEQYIYKTNFNEQINIYLLALSLIYGKPVTKLIYTAIQKPQIRLKKDETQEQFLQRQFEWYSENTQEKIGCFNTHRTPEELDLYADELRAIAKEIRNCKVFYRNPSACSIYGCQYSHLCLDNYHDSSKGCL